MIIGIDAVNIRRGGGITHLRELLNHADPLDDKFKKIILWSCSDTLDQIKDKPWLEKKDIHAKNFMQRLFWQLFFLTKEAKQEKCNVLLIPGGSFTTKFRPIVTMNHNLLPFQFREFMRYGFSIKSLKFFLLFFIQRRSFNNSDGIIFLTKNAKNIVSKFLSRKKREMKVINHGIEERFFYSSEHRERLKKNKSDNTLKIIIVSAVEPYKHHFNLIRAVSELKKEDYSVELDIFGTGHKPSIKLLKKNIKFFDPYEEFISYKGNINYSEIEKIYKEGEIMLFSSSCETFGQTLTEAMAGSLVVASSKLEPMPELLKDSGVYFDPFDYKDVKLKVKGLLDSPELRRKLSFASYNRALEFSWYDCASETFKFLRSFKNIEKNNVQK